MQVYWLNNPKLSIPKSIYQVCWEQLLHQACPDNCNWFCIISQRVTAKNIQRRRQNNSKQNAARNFQENSFRKKPSFLVNSCSHSPWRGRRDRHPAIPGINLLGLQEVGHKNWICQQCWKMWSCGHGSSWGHLKKVRVHFCCNYVCQYVYVWKNPSLNFCPRCRVSCRETENPGQKPRLEHPSLGGGLLSREGHSKLAKECVLTCGWNPPIPLLHFYPLGVVWAP